MPRSYYEVLGRIVWTGGVWYVKRRLLPKPRRGRRRVVATRMGVGALVVVAIGGAILVAQRRGDDAV
jgi:hypothetical protein